MGQMAYPVGLMRKSRLMFWHNKEIFTRLDQDIDQGRPEGLAYKNTLTSSTPTEITNLVPFCKAVCKSIFGTERKLMLPTAWGIWPNQEDWTLYYLANSGGGFRGRFEDFPCHEFGAHEDDLASTYLSIFISFGFDVAIRPFRRGERAFLSHEGYLTIETDRDISDYVSRLELVGSAVDSTLLSH